MELPKFSEAGLLPPADYVMTVEELRNSLLVAGPPGEAGWDAAWRRELVDNLESVLRDLWALQIECVVVDGSFVERVGHPGDIDVYFPVPLERWLTREIERGLNERRSESVWTWDPAARTADAETGKRHLPFWHRYRIDLFPDLAQLANGVLTFPEFFRQTRSGEAKGVVKIVRP